MKNTTANITVVIIVVAICVTVYFWHSIPPPLAPDAQLAREIAVHARESLADAYHVLITPQVQIDQRVIVQQNTPVLELATASRNVAAEYTYKNTWMGSEKVFVIRGIYIAKGGFDLSSNATFGVDIDHKTMRMVASLPEPKLLSCEQKEFSIVRDENGYWNKLKPEDRQTAINGLNKAAEQNSIQGGLLPDAKAAMGTTITKVLQDSKASDVEIRYH